MKTVSSLAKIFARENITSIESEKRGSCLLGESYNFQIVLRSDTDADGLTLRLKGVNGKYTLYRVHELKAGLERYGDGDDYMLHAEDKKYPELLLESSSVVLKKGENAVFWANLSDLEAGAAEIKISLLRGEESLVSASYRLRVIDAALPKAEGQFTTWIHYDCIAEKSGTVPFSKEFYQAFEHYLSAYTQLGMNTLLVPSFTPALDTGVGGERMTA